MKNETQLERYKRLAAYIDEKFKEEINIEKVEEISHYSYRNINRIFHALHQETIGKYIKRIRLEKAAQYLKYSDTSISDIAFDVGFEDVAAFSKAFKNKFGSSPSAFRNSQLSIHEMIRRSFLPPQKGIREELEFDIEYLPDFYFLSLEYKGSYGDSKAIQGMWELLTSYASEKELLTADSIFMAEILDDDEISESIHCRYNVALILDQRSTFQADALFTVKHHKRQKYAKFVHQGAHESSQETYNRIYAFWMLDVQLEMADLPMLEFYLNDEVDTPTEELLTEIYIPVQ